MRSHPGGTHLRAIARPVGGDIQSPQRAAPRAAQTVVPCSLRPPVSSLLVAWVSGTRRPAGGRSRRHSRSTSGAPSATLSVSWDGFRRGWQPPGGRRGGGRAHGAGKTSFLSVITARIKSYF